MSRRAIGRAIRAEYFRRYRKARHSVRTLDESKYMQQIKVNSTGLDSQPSVKVAKHLLVIMLS